MCLLFKLSVKVVILSFADDYYYYCLCFIFCFISEHHHNKSEQQMSHWCFTFTYIALWLHTSAIGIFFRYHYHSIYLHLPLDVNVLTLRTRFSLALASCARFYSCIHYWTGKCQTTLACNGSTSNRDLCTFVPFTRNTYTHTHTDKTDSISSWSRRAQFCFWLKFKPTEYNIEFK